MAKSKLPKDVNQGAVIIAKIATGEIENPDIEKDEVKKAVAALGRLGGLSQFEFFSRFL